MLSCYVVSVSECYIGITDAYNLVYCLFYFSLIYHIYICVCVWSMYTCCMGHHPLSYIFTVRLSSMGHIVAVTSQLAINFNKLRSKQNAAILQFQMHFHKKTRMFWHFNWYFNGIRSYEQYVGIISDNGLVPNLRQTITKTITNIDHWHIRACVNRRQWVGHQFWCAWVRLIMISTHQWSLLPRKLTGD